MSYSAQDVIRIAKSQIGYYEKSSNSNLDVFSGSGSGNFTKYARDFDQKWPEFYNGRKNGFDWCDVFVDWCHVMAAGGDSEAARAALCQPKKSAGAGCTYSAQYYKSAGRWGLTPQLGAQIFFGDYDHTGLVYSYDNTYVYTIEGNTSGGCVAYKSYYRTSSWVLGYGYPKYGESSSSAGSSSSSAASTKTLKVYSPMKTYKNGSTKEPVYKDTDLITQTGTLNAYEQCYCSGRYGGAYAVVYKIDGYEDRWATGYVGYNGGVTD